MTRRAGKPLRWYRSAAALDEPLRLVSEKAGVPELSPHALRRTWEGLMRKAGVDEFVRRSVSGWRTERAQGIYSIIDRDDRDQAGAAVLNLVFGAPKGPTATPGATPGAKNENARST